MFPTSNNVLAFKISPKPISSSLKMILRFKGTLGGLEIHCLSTKMNCQENKGRCWIPNDGTHACDHRVPVGSRWTRRKAESCSPVISVRSTERSGKKEYEKKNDFRKVLKDLGYKIENSKKDGNQVYIFNAKMMEAKE